MSWFIASTGIIQSLIFLSPNWSLSILHSCTVPYGACSLLKGTRKYIKNNPQIPVKEWARHSVWCQIKGILVNKKKNCIYKLRWVYAAPQPFTENPGQFQNFVF